MSEEKATHRLEDLNTLEVSLVKRAANKRTFALWKDEQGLHDDPTWLDTLDGVMKDYEEEDFSNGCAECGYGDKELILKTANCPFCFNPTEINGNN